MKDRISKKDQRKKDDYRNKGSLAELGALGTKRKAPTGCNSIIEMHETEPFSFKTIPKSPALSPAAFHPHQLASTAGMSSPPSTFRYATPCMWPATSDYRGASSRSHPSWRRGFPRGAGPGRGTIGSSSLSRRRTRTRTGRGSQRARVRRVRRVRQLREPTFGTSLGSEGPQCWSKDHFHTIITRSSKCIYV
jgi:hypothetical protein